MRKPGMPQLQANQGLAYHDELGRVRHNALMLMTCHHFIFVGATSAAVSAPIAVKHLQAQQLDVWLTAS